MKYEAVRLFHDRASAAESTFTLSDQNARVVVDVCTRLDGIPLAIELAAARVKVLTVDQIAARLDDPFRLLTGGSQRALPRQQTLRATMDWSYDLLSEPERILLRRLSVFAGGWTLEAAEAICGGEGVEASEVLDLLTQLVDKSLVVAETRKGEARYRLLETVRQYGLDRLAETGETAGLRSRHRDWCLGLAERAYPELRGPHGEVWLRQLEAEHDNLRGALAWSLEVDIEGGLRLGGALGRFWAEKDYYAEGRTWLTQVLERTNGVATPARARALHYAGLFAWVQGEFRKAVALGEDGVLLARQIGDGEDLAGSLYVLGVAQMAMGNYERAAGLLDETRSLCRALGDKSGMARAVRHGGHTAARQGDYPLAITLLEEAVALYREVGDKLGIAFSFRHLGVVRHYQRDYTQAVVLLEQSLTLFRDLKAIEGTAYALAALASTVRQGRDYERAWSLYEEGLILSRDFGLRWAILECLYGVAGMSASQGKFDRGARLIGAAEALRERIDYSLPLSDRADSEDTVRTIQGALGDALFSAVRAEGRAMTLEQAIAYALAPGSPPLKIAGSEKAAPGKHPGHLTLREEEIAGLIAKGLTNRRIATKLVIAKRTADTHVQHILNKLGVNSRAEIAAWAVEHGLHRPVLDETK